MNEDIQHSLPRCQFARVTWALSDLECRVFDKWRDSCEDWMQAVWEEMDIKNISIGFLSFVGNLELWVQETDGRIRGRSTPTYPADSSIPDNFQGSKYAANIGSKEPTDRGVGSPSIGDDQD